MKQFFRKITSLVTSAALVCSLALPAAAASSEALGDTLSEHATVLHEGSTLHQNVLYSNFYSDLRRESYIEYTPNALVTPIVTYGDSVSVRTSVSAAAEALEAQGYRVVAGINGDYFGVAHGVPLGVVMTDGVLRNASNEHYAIGFRDDGSAILGAPQITMSAATNRGGEFPVTALNQVRYSYAGIYLYTSNFNARHSTGTNEAGYDVVCVPRSGTLSIGDALTLEVKQILPEAVDTVVAEGEYVLTANLSAGEAALGALRALEVGDVLTLSVSAADEKWNDVTNMVGALYALVEDGAVAEGLEAGAAPRTAVGQREDGSLIFYTIDGRQKGYSIGATLTQVAQRLVELGCVTALSLDGGGSTALSATAPDQKSAGIVTSPSDGYERAVTNHIFLVASARRSGQVNHIYLRAEHDYALPGALVALRAAAIDTTYIPMDAAVTLSTDSGSIEETQLRAPMSGSAAVTGEYGYKSASVTVEVVENPDAIKLYRDETAISELTLAPGESAALTAEAIKNRLPIAGGAENFNWTLSEEVGTVENGVLTAAQRAASGELTVGVGTAALTIPVTVSTAPNVLLDDCESAPLDSSFLLNTDKTYVHSGSGSYRLDYALEADGMLSVPLNISAVENCDYLGMWVYGDGQGEQLLFEAEGETIAAAAIDFTGWQHIMLPLSAEKSISALSLYCEESLTGSLYFDTFIASPRSGSDEDAPELSLALAEDGSLTGRAFDAVDAAALSLTLTLDGNALAHEYSAASGALSAALPSPDALPHRVTLTARDRSGNIARVSLDLTGAEGGEAPFTDTAGHWSEPYVAVLKARGVTNGDGEGHYFPNDNLTREEFAAMLYRYLAPTEDFSATALPFADNDDISPWAVEGVRAMVALGVTRGSTTLSGELCFLPKDSITREEAVTMLGRLFERGYRVSPAAFSDSDAISSWAADSVELLSGVGVLSGFDDGSFRPRECITRAQIASVFYKLQ